MCDDQVERCSKCGCELVHSAVCLRGEVWCLECWRRPRHGALPLRVVLTAWRKLIWRAVQS